MADPIYLKMPPHGLVVSLNYDKAVEGLGRICVEFQRLETNLKAAVGLLIDPEDFTLSLIITSQLSFKAVLDLFSSLYHHRFNDAVEDKELSEFLGQCNMAEERRNQIIHSNWRPDTEGGKGAIRTKFTARRSLKSQQQVLSKEDLQKEAEDLRALRDTFFKMWAPRIDRYANSLAAHALLPDTSRAQMQIAHKLHRKP
jgi:hypothetical protein